MALICRLYKIFYIRLEAQGTNSCAGGVQPAAQIRANGDRPAVGRGLRRLASQPRPDQGDKLLYLFLI